MRAQLLTEEGYPALQRGGGFELLRCSSNCRQLEVVKGKWDVTVFGSQCKVYVRPIQNSLNVEPVNALLSTTTIQEECQ